MNLPDYKQYRIDINGDSPENLVKNELIKRGSVGNGSVLVPRHAPFFHESLSLTHPDGSPMFLGKDYQLIDLDDRWVWQTAAPVGIFIKLLNDKIQDVVAQYQTIGTCPLFNKYLSNLTTLALDDPREIWYDDLDNKPKIFPLKLHSHDINIDIYAVELLSKTLEERFDLIYENKDGSIHESFFLAQLNNLRSYFPIVREELKDRSLKHTGNIWNAHWVRGGDIHGIDQVENVKTATMKETLALESDRLRLAVRPVYQTIAKEGVNENACLNITGMELNVKKTMVPGKGVFSKDHPIVGIKGYSSGYFISTDGIGYGLAMGYDGVSEGVVILMNHNPYGELANPSSNEWVNTHSLLKPSVAPNLNAVIRGSNHLGMMVGNYRTNEWFYFTPNASIKEKDQKWVKLTLPAGDKFDLDFVREAVFIPYQGGGYLLRQSNEYDFGKVKVWCVDGNGIIKPTVDGTDVHGKRSSNAGLYNLFDFDLDFEGKATGGLIKLNGRVEYDAGDTGLSAILLPDATADYVKLFVNERYGDDLDGIDVPSQVILRMKRNGNTLTITTEDWSAEKLDVKLIGKPFKHPNLAKFPTEFCGNGRTLTDFGKGWLLLTSRDQYENFVCVTSFKESFFYPQVYNAVTFKANGVFKPNGDDFTTNKNGIMSVKRFRPLNMSCWHNTGDRIGGYSETEFMGGSVVFKSIDSNGKFRHFMKKVGSRILARNMKDETVWLRDPSNIYIPLPYIQQNQISVSVNDLTNPEVFGSTWFNAISKSNEMMEGSLRVGIGTYFINDINEMTMSFYYAVHESFVEQLLGEPIRPNMFWTLLFTNDEKILGHNILLVHYIENGKMRSVVKLFDVVQKDLLTTKVEGSKAYLFNDKTKYSLFSTHTYNNYNFDEKGIESTEFITNHEGYESGKFIIRKTEQETMLIYVSNGFVQENDWFRPNPVSAMILLNPYHAVTSIEPMSVYDEDIGLYYIRSLGWQMTTGDGDYLLGGGCLPSFPVVHDIVSLQTGKTNGEVPVSPIDRLTVKEWNLYASFRYLLTHNGRNFIIEPSYLDIRDAIKNYASKQLYVYLNVLSGRPVYEVREQLINHPDRLLMARVLTNETGIVEVENY